MWSGVYRHYRDVPAHGPGFTGEVWVNLTRAHTRHALTDLRSQPRAPAPPGDQNILPLLLAALARERQRVTVLDFGGGMGIGYVDVRRALGLTADIDFTIVETAEVCAAARELFVGDESIRFCASFDEVRAQPDVVHVNSALQYVEDYPGVLSRLARYRAGHMLFVNASAGDIPTYATAQLNVPGSVLPYWFLNLAELVALLDLEGYSLLATAESERRLVGLAVPRSHRIERGRNLLFGRKGPA